MSALSRPIFVFVAGFLICGCGQDGAAPSPALLRAPKFLAAENLQVLSVGEGPVTLRAEDIMELSLAAGPAPERADALQIQLSCRAEGREELFLKEHTLPWSSRINIMELVPEKALHPSYAKSLIHCLMDLSLWDDSGNKNFQKGLPLNLINLGQAGALDLAGDTTGGILAAEDFEDLTLEGLGTHDTLNLEILCQDLGPSNWGAPAVNLQKLMQNYFRETEGLPSSHQAVPCRIFHHADSGPSEFTKVFTLLRPFKEPGASLSARVNSIHPSRITTEVDVTVTNPNPFAMDIFLSDGKLWERYILNYSSRNGFHTAQPVELILGPQKTFWQAPKNFEEVTLPYWDGKKNTPLKGWRYTLPAGQKTTLPSRNGFTPSYLCGEQRMAVASIGLQPSAELPIWISYLNRVGPAVRYPGKAFPNHLYQNSSHSELPIEMWPSKWLSDAEMKKKPANCAFWN